MKKARVYSYLRFSDPRQRSGSSIERQTNYAREWADKHGLALDESLSLRDEGLSAYHQKHVKNGALGVFLRAVEEGRVPDGSVLIVENLDRLSRAEPIIAQNQLTSIVLAGVRVVTASDGVEYSRETVKSNPGILFMALGSMLKANLESDDKSKRVRGALLKQCKAWEAGTWRGKLCAGRDPFWTKWDEKKRRFVLDATLAKTARALVKHFRAGNSPMRSLELLAESGLPFPKEGLSNASRAWVLLGSRMLIGEREVVFDKTGEKFTLEAYYPPLLDEVAFAELQHLRAQRGRRVGKRDFPGLITGLGLCRCGYCGSGMNGQNILTRGRREDGLPQEGHRRVVCGGKYAIPKCTAGSCSIVPIERAIMAHCSNAFNLSALLETTADTGPLATKLAAAREKVAKTERRIGNLAKALADDDSGKGPGAVMKMLHDLEGQLGTERASVERLQHEITALQGASQPASADVWASLVQDVEALDHDARVKARQLVADTFAEILVYTHGMDRKSKGSAAIREAKPGETPVVDVVLVAKSGRSHLLRVDRASGELVLHREIDLKPDTTARTAQPVKPKRTRRATATEAV